MDPLTALCLSLPPSAALAILGYHAVRAVNRAASEASRESDATRATIEAVAGRVEVATSALATATRYAAEVSSAAALKAARYQAKAIRVTPKPDAPPPKTLYEQFLASDGSKGKSESDLLQIEFAFDMILGDDAGSEAGDAGTPEGASEILDTLAGIGWSSTARALAEKRVREGR